jgi:hypothetical protein
MSDTLPTLTVISGAQSTNPDFPDAFAWRVTLHYQGRGMTVRYYMGPALTGQPEVRDVLNCLVSDADLGAESFDDFCADLGYEPTARNRRTWQQCQRYGVSLAAVLGDDYDRIAAWAREA